MQNVLFFTSYFHTIGTIRVYYSVHEIETAMFVSLIGNSFFLLSMQALPNYF